MIKKTLKFPAEGAMIAWLVLCLLIGSPLSGQEAPEAAAPGVAEESGRLAPYRSNFLKDEAEMWTAPFHLDGKELLAFGTVLAATGLLIANDEAIYKEFKAFQADHSWADKASPVLTLLGDWGLDCGVAGVFFLGGVLARDRRARDTGLMAWETLLHTGCWSRSPSTCRGASARRSLAAATTGTVRPRSSSATRAISPTTIPFFPATPSRPGAWRR